MATITAGDFRNGKTFEMDGKVMQVVEFQHVKPGKGAAFVRTKMRNVVTGAVTETSFNPTAKFEEAFVDRRDMAYSYNDGDLYYFMDQETYAKVLKENKGVAIDVDTSVVPELVTDGEGSVTDNAEDQTVTATGAVTEIRSQIENGSTCYYIRLAGVDKFVKVSADKEPSAIFYAVGDVLTVTYKATDDAVLWIEADKLAYTEEVSEAA